MAIYTPLKPLPQTFQILLFLTTHIKFGTLPQIVHYSKTFRDLCNWFIHLGFSYFVAFRAVHFTSVSYHRVPEDDVYIGLSLFHTQAVYIRTMKCFQPKDSQMLPQSLGKTFFS